jgi:hypothetical protein|mmetsp:Transcript_101574/g.171974  ORF Transcript_101574/g.171974 Transcript_101574/m.171974 type:complete len:92 (-) Transcript_101574:85-360(-)
MSSNSDDIPWTPWQHIQDVSQGEGSSTKQRYRRVHTSPGFVVKRQNRTRVKESCACVRQCGRMRGLLFKGRRQAMASSELANMQFNGKTTY